MVFFFPKRYFKKGNLFFGEFIKKQKFLFFFFFPVRGFFLSYPQPHLGKKKFIRRGNKNFFG